MQAAVQNPDHLGDLTSYCKAIADHQRLLILRVLARESFGVLELCHILDAAQPALSHHLKVLHTAGLVETRRQGTSIFYRRATIAATDPLREVRHSLQTTLDKQPLSEALSERAAEIYATRHQQAKQFFEKNAHRFLEDQNLIAEYPNYAACIADLLNDEVISVTNAVIEIGPGESELIFDLAKRFPKVVAIDNTEDMLEITRRKLASRDATNITCFLGQLTDYNGNSDLIVTNMVLHHLASPAQFFHDAFRYLGSSGTLLIADLCAHDQDWTRETCGDLWLGFEPEELDRWAGNAGFESGQSAYVGLKNGFQVQVRLFHKHHQTKE